MFNKAYAKEKDNCNTKVTKHIVTSPINFILLSG